MERDLLLTGTLIWPLGRKWSLLHPSLSLGRHGLVGEKIAHGKLCRTCRGTMFPGKEEKARRDPPPNLVVTATTLSTENQPCFCLALTCR